MKLLLLGFIFFAACTSTLTGYEFSTDAIYSAEKSRVVALVNSRGSVKAGHDIGSGKIYGKLIFIEPCDTFSFIIVNDTFSEILHNGIANRIKKSGKIAEEILSLQPISIIKTIDTTEILELSEAILSVGRGPKGTLMKGQTKYIRVEKTVFNRN